MGQTKESIIQNCRNQRMRKVLEPISPAVSDSPITVRRHAMRYRERPTHKAVSEIEPLVEKNKQKNKHVLQYLTVYSDDLVFFFFL